MCIDDVQAQKSRSGVLDVGLCMVASFVTMFVTGKFVEERTHVS